MGFLIRFLLFVSTTLFLGLGSAWLLIDGGSMLTTRQIGPWTNWVQDGVLDADPYTHARVSRFGYLPVTSGSLLSYTADEDSEGNALSGDCTYEIRGQSFPALWWNLAAFTRDGRLLENKAKRHAFNSGNLLLTPSGDFFIRLSPDVQPGNWLPAQPGEDIRLRIEVLRPVNPERLRNQSTPETMPQITMVGC
jgi:hypothetical protein